MTQKNSASDIALKLYNAISNSSVEYVADQLDRICETSAQFVGIEKEIVDYIVNVCCVKYQVSQESIKKNRIRRIKDINSLFARDMCVILIKRHVHSSTHEKIAKEMKKQNHTFVCQVLKNYENMQGKVKHEREFLEAFEELNEKVFSFRKKHKLNMNQEN